ncbi:hypothetical protein [Pedobacter sp. MC2016-24]|uniref:hypothetical protein n=1 Tax=Pedobacter sp. MC2016-24 TaxID=2780090 RepID=UPI00187F17F7|nr:hypothetical protein [Pedobacter sp. MC2016-24]MBE9597864.1 hypothetical protein [Pedobacter sp. MC2016-24]
MLEDNVVLSNNENRIRDVLYLNYLNENSVRNKIKLKNYYFDREILEDETNGRTDIRVLSPYSFEDTKAYYILECKRLNAINPDGKSGLNSEYTNNGICRFASKTYSTYYKTNGMIGFVVEEIDIHQNTASINKLLKSCTQSNTSQVLKFREIIPDFEYTYCSSHDLNGDNILLYHLMLDFSKHIG